MSNNFTQFEREIRIFAEVVVPDDLQKIVKKLALQVLQGVVLKTPVDSGRARGNWMVAINDVPQGFIEIGKFTRDEATDFALSRGIPIVESSKPYTAISIANNVPYIGVLEFGSSKQSPEGMLRVTLANIQAQFQ